jgi:hypothetical protein
MSTVTTTAPEVAEFIRAVQAHLADLDPDEQREILDGLEADLTDLVAERGGDALGDPGAYARELRQAAGLEPEMRRSASSGPRRSLGASISGLMDASRQGLDVVLAKLPGDAAGVLTWLRPLWWVLRGWVAVQLLDMHGGRPRANLVPDLDGFGWLLCLVAIAGSIAIGRGVVWPGGSGRGAPTRVVLLGLNVFAVVVTPITISHVVDSVNQRYDRGSAVGFEHGYRAAMNQPGDGPKAGLYLDGTWVSNIYPYDAKGRPLVGVQLFNQAGKPINVITQAEMPEEQCSGDTGVCGYPSGTALDADGNPLLRVYYPWTNGAAQLLNVFPIPSRLQQSDQPSATAFTEKNRPAIGAFPHPSVPKVSLPGIKPGLLPQER